MELILFVEYARSLGCDTQNGVYTCYELNYNIILFFYWEKKTRQLIYVYTLAINSRQDEKFFTK